MSLMKQRVVIVQIMVSWERGVLMQPQKLLSSRHFYDKETRGGKCIPTAVLLMRQDEWSRVHSEDLDGAKLREKTMALEALENDELPLIEFTHTCI